MIANLNNRAEIESFLRFANQEQLLAEKSHIEALLGDAEESESETFLKALAGRIKYELRFRTKAPLWSM